MPEQTTAAETAEAAAEIRRTAAAEYAMAVTATIAAGAIGNGRGGGGESIRAAESRVRGRAALDAAEHRLRRFVQLANIAVALGRTDRSPIMDRSAVDKPHPGVDGVDLRALTDALRRVRTPWPTNGQLGISAALTQAQNSAQNSAQSDRQPEQHSARIPVQAQVQIPVQTAVQIHERLPVVVDGPDALDRALDALAEPVPPVDPVPADPAPAGGSPAPDRPQADLLAAVQQVMTVLFERALAAPGRAGDTATPADETAIVIRLLSGVVRPLGEVVGRVVGRDAGPDADPPAGPGSPSDRPVAELLLDLADRATALAGPRAAAGLLEATATLQDLAVRSAPDAAALRQRWWTALGEPAPLIRVARNGPYLALCVRETVDHLGTPIAPAQPVTALCRCGRSGLKPLCDGSHARFDFTGDKDPRRVPDQRDRHPGLQVTVLDNRGTCAHSGFCTSRLPTVFRQGAEPFVAASGGRMDEIVRAVRDCPSGALSFEIEEREAREQVDWNRAPGIEVSQDGPYRVTGGIALHDGSRPGDGPQQLNEGGSAEHFSLCRCGQSQNKPFCSGMHWYVGFTDPVPDPDEVPTVFEWVGGLPALRRLTRRFYEKYIPEDPLLAPVFAQMSTDHPERVATWLGEVFGGPKYYTDEFGGYPRMISQHIGKGLTEEQRSRWAALMVRSADDVELPADPEFRAAFVSYVEWGSRIAVENSTDGAVPPPGMPVPQWWWACNATPRARVSALAPAPAEPPYELPAPDVVLSFETHIRPMFRAVDRNSMRFVFDLWSLDDVTAHAEAILRRLREQTMPCDGGWPPERIEVFRRWVEAGTAP